MILKTEYVNGKCVAALLMHIHSKANLLFPDNKGNHQCVVDVKTIEAMSKPDSDEPIDYRVTLDITEWTGNRDNRERIDPKHLLKVYEILGKKHPEVCGDDGILTGEKADQLYAQAEMNRFLGDKIPYSCIDTEGNLLYSANQKMTKTLMFKLIAHLRHLVWEKGVNHELVRVLEQLRKGLD